MVQLTDHRSVALDHRTYRLKGVLVFSDVREDIPEAGRSDRPELREPGVVRPPFQRFLIDQDTGGAIRGPARADLYFGEGRAARIGAHGLHATGQLYFLMPRPPG